MTSLNRLKGSPLLVQGFDEFLGGWLAEDYPGKYDYPWYPEAVELLEKMPPSVREFYEIAMIRPRANLLSGRDFLGAPPSPRKIWNETTRVIETPDPSLIRLIRTRNGQLEICLSIDAEDYGKLYLMPSGEKANSEIINLPLEEFLVSFGFLQLFGKGESPDEAMPEEWLSFEESKPLFSGCFQEGRELTVRQHHEAGYLWLTEPGRDRLWLKKE